MASVLPPCMPSCAGTFSSGPNISSSYPDLASLDSGVPYNEDLEAKRGFVHAEYDNSFAASIPSTAPSSPLYIQSMGSRDSFFSTPTYSSLDPNEDFDYDDNDPPFPCFDYNVPQPVVGEQKRLLGQLDKDTCDSVLTVSPPCEKTRRVEDQETKDDHWIKHEPTRHVDYLAHAWQEQDIWSSWKYVNAREKRKRYGIKEGLTNGERLENAAWRTWTKAKYDLPTISPESLNWMKDCDVTWLYGPLHVNIKSDMYCDHSLPPSSLSTSSSFLHKKPILKKKSASAALLERSLTEHNLLSRVGEIIRVQQSSPVPRRQSLRRAGSDYSLPSYHTSSVLNTPAEFSRSEQPPRYSFGADTPLECKHVLFNEEVRQVQAIESDDDDKVVIVEEDQPESDEDDDGGLMMAPARFRSNKGTPRGSFSDNNKTIAPLPPTTLKYRKDTPEPPEVPLGTSQSWTPRRGLQHSASQETLKPANPSQNFLLDDDPELSDEPWCPKAGAGQDFSPYAQEDQNEPQGMRRTASGMFMPYDENEEEAAMNNTLFGQAIYAVNTFRDIAHVVWNVGWNRK